MLSLGDAPDSDVGGRYAQLPDPSHDTRVRVAAAEVGVPQVQVRIQVKYPKVFEPCLRGGHKGEGDGVFPPERQEEAVIPHDGLRLDAYGLEGVRRVRGGQIGRVERPDTESDGDLQFFVEILDLTACPQDGGRPLPGTRSVADGSFIGEGQDDQRGPGIGRGVLVDIEEDAPIFQNRCIPSCRLRRR